MTDVDADVRAVAASVIRNIVTGVTDTDNFARCVGLMRALEQRHTLQRLTSSSNSVRA